jgi:hypothetical protein
MSQAFGDVNSNYVLRLNPGGICFSMRLLVKQMCEPYERFLKVG